MASIVEDLPCVKDQPGWAGWVRRAECCGRDLFGAFTQGHFDGEGFHFEALSRQTG